jgi:hypothetical protein
LSSSVVPPANDSPVLLALELVHHHPGRLRVRADVLRDDGGLAERVRAALEGLPGVSTVLYTARTGSILVEYEPGLAEPEAIVERIAKTADLASPFDPRALRPHFRPVAGLIGATRELNAVAAEVTGRRVDLRSIVPAALAGAAAYSFAFGKGPRLPRWDNLLWWAYSVFASLHASEMSEAGAGTPPEGTVGLP